MNQRRPLYALLVATTLAVTAETLSMVAIPWFVLELTGSYAQMGLVGFFTFAPRVVAAFLGGQAVDRIGFRNASMFSDVLSGISVCFIPILYATDQLTITWLIVLVVIGAFFDAPGSTAKDAMVPELAQRAGVHLDRVNAWFQGARRVASLVGPVLAGLLIGLVGTNNAFWGNTVVFALSALLTLTLVPVIHSGANEIAHGGESFIQRTLFGFRFLKSHPLMLWLATMVCITNFLDAPFTTVEMPALVNNHYGDAQQLGVMLGVDGAGAAFGTFLFGMFAPRLKRRPVFIGGFLWFGVWCLVLSFAPPYPIALVVLFLMGIAAGPLNPILMSIRQERVPIAYRARVYGAGTTLSFLAIPIGQVLGGYLVEWFGPQIVLGGVAIVYMVFVGSFLFNPTLHEMDDRRGVAQSLESAA